MKPLPITSQLLIVLGIVAVWPAMMGVVKLCGATWAQAGEWTLIPALLFLGPAISGLNRND